MNSKIIIEQENIEFFEKEADEFVLKIFNLQNALVTDLSDLSDFFGSGLDKEQSQEIQKLSHKNAIKFWDKIIMERVKQEYGIELTNVCVNLFSIVQKIAINKSENKSIH